MMEVVIAMAIFVVFGVVLFTFGTTVSRLIYGNLAVNHGHQDARLTGARLFDDLQGAASTFTLFRVSGSSYVDLLAPADEVPAITDMTTGFRISQRTNGVRFWRPLGGPCRLTSSPTRTSTTMTFSTGPQVIVIGDKVLMPLISKEFRVTAVSRAGSSTTITTDQAVDYDFTKVTHNTTGYFFRSTAYALVNEQLRYHPNLTGATLGAHTVVRRGITTPNPFSLVGPANDRKLRISFETRDAGLSARRFVNSTTTFQSVFTPLQMPALIKP